MRKKQLQDAIQNKKEEIAEKKSEIDNFEIDVDEHIDDYKEMLNETNDTVRIGSLKYDPAMVLKEVDPTAYDCGLNDYVDSLDKDDDPKYQALEEQLEALEDELTDLEDKLEEMED